MKFEDCNISVDKKFWIFILHLTNYVFLDGETLVAIDVFSINFIFLAPSGHTLCSILFLGYIFSPSFSFRDVKMNDQRKHRKMIVKSVPLRIMT